MDKFSTGYWEGHWTKALAHQAHARSPPAPANPHLIGHTAHLTPTRALDAGCGTCIEALWLAEQGWAVTGADISGTALAAAQRRHAENPPTHAVEWVKTDIARWSPERTWDLVVTHYAHPDTGQLKFYQHIARFVAPGGTLLIAAHARGFADHPQHPQAEMVSAEEVTALFAPPRWEVESCSTETREAGPTQLHDAVIRLRRLT